MVEKKTGFIMMALLVLLVAMAGTSTARNAKLASAANADRTRISATRAVSSRPWSRSSQTRAASPTASFTNSEPFVQATQPELTTEQEQKEADFQKKAAPKVIYLTFDDGPGPYTRKLLRILQQRNIKATFFVTGEFAKYQNCIRLESQLGHTVGVHSYSHNYRIYSSPKAFWTDYQKMDAAVAKQTGTHAWCFRFPGGSSNTVSRRYCSGIMKTLARQAGEKGLTYVDWNASAGDAENAKTPEAVKNHIIRDIGSQRQVIVLCHDTKPYTVNAMDAFITWGLQHGYQFQPLTPGSFVVHHHINN